MIKNKIETCNMQKNVNCSSNFFSLASKYLFSLASNNYHMKLDNVGFYQEWYKLKWYVLSFTCIDYGCKQISSTSVICAKEKRKTCDIDTFSNQWEKNIQTLAPN